MGDDRREDEILEKEEIYEGNRREMNVGRKKWRKG